MFYNPYFKKRKYKYVNKLDDLLDLDSYTKEDIFSLNSKLRDLEATFKEEIDSVSEEFRFEVKDFVSRYSHINHINGRVITEPLVKMVSRVDSSKALYNEISLKDIGATIKSEIEKIFTIMDDYKSPRYEENDVDAFLKIITYLLMYEIEDKDTYIPKSDEMFFKELRDNLYSYLYQLDTLTSIYVRYLDKLERLAAVRFLKRCNSRMLRLDDINFKEVNYLELEIEDREKFKEDNSEITNEKTKQNIIDDLVIEAIKMGTFYDSKNDKYYNFLRKKESKDGPIIKKKVGEYITEFHSEKVVIGKRQIDRKIDKTIKRLKDRDIKLKKEDLEHDIPLYDIVM